MTEQSARAQAVALGYPDQPTTLFDPADGAGHRVEQRVLPSSLGWPVDIISEDAVAGGWDPASGTGMQMVFTTLEPDLPVLEGRADAYRPDEGVYLILRAEAPQVFSALRTQVEAALAADR